MTDLSMRELPQIMANSYNSNTINPGTGHVSNSVSSYAPPIYDPTITVVPVQTLLRGYTPNLPPGVISMGKPPRRLVQIFIADPDENVPVDDCLLYSGEQKLTDLTDQELFFEIDVRTLLEKHNITRITLLNKSVKERTEHLEPARIRDLRMTVVTIAQF